MCNAWSIEGYWLSNKKVVTKFWVIPSQSVVMRHNSTRRYQLIGVMSSVLMNLCTHYSWGMLLQDCSELLKWSFGHLWPVYQTLQPSTCAENRDFIKVRHCNQSIMLLLCAPHHLAGVSLRTSSITNSLCCIGTLSSKSDKKVSKGFRPSKVGKLLTVVSI